MRNNLHIVYKVDNTCKGVDGRRVKTWCPFDRDWSFDAMLNYDDGWVSLFMDGAMVFKREKDRPPLWYI